MRGEIIIGALIWLVIRTLILFRNEKYKSLSIKREIIFNMFVIYCIAVAVVTLPDIRMIGMPGSNQLALNIVPFVDIINGFQNSFFPFTFKLKLLSRNLLGNIALLLPLGVFLPMLSSKFRCFKKTVSVGVIVSLTIELMQLMFSFFGIRGRIADIDDLIFNSIGVMFGYFIYIRIIARFSLLSHFEL